MDFKEFKEFLAPFVSVPVYNEVSRQAGISPNLKKIKRYESRANAEYKAVVKELEMENTKLRNRIRNKQLEKKKLEKRLEKLESTE